MINLLKTKKTQNGNTIFLFGLDPIEKSNYNTVLFIGVFHGDEPEGEELINHLMEDLRESSELANGNKVLFIPCLNPDGKVLNTRGNALGVDLNRNFPTKNWEKTDIKDHYYSGESSASELETIFLIDVIDEYKPDLIISLHTPYRVVNYDGPAESIARKISEITGYPVQEYIGYPTPGSFGTYTGIERNIPIITLELPENESPNYLWQQVRDAFIFSIKQKIN